MENEKELALALVTTLTPTPDIGYVKNHRSLLDTELHKDDQRFKVYMTILLSVKWKHEPPWKYKGVEYQCGPGQMVTSYEGLANRCNSKHIDKSKVRRILEWLVKHGYITLETRYRQSIKITVRDWHITQAQKPTQETAQEPAQETNPETPINIDVFEGDEKKAAQKPTQETARIKEGFKKVKEKGGGTENNPPSPSHKKILKTYYTLYQKYTGESKHTSFKKDSQMLDKYQIPVNDTDTVITMLTKWFEYADKGTVNSLYPLAWFCSQYDEICSKLKDKIEAQREEDRREAVRIERQRRQDEEERQRDKERHIEEQRIASLTPEQRELEKIDNRIQTLNLFITGRQQANDTSLLDKVREYQSELKELERRRAELTQQ